MEGLRRDPAAAAATAYDLIVVGGGIYGAMTALEAARRGLQPTAGKAAHGVVKALAQSRRLADDAFVGDEEIVVENLERMHAAIAERGDRTSRNSTAARILVVEFVSVGGRLLDHE